MKEYARVKYGVVGKPFFVKPACVDLERFSERDLKRPDLIDRSGLRGKLVAVYAGKLGGIYLDKEVFQLLRVARDHWGERFHVLLLTAHTTDEVMAFAREAGLDRSMFTIRYVPHAQIPEYMGLGDLALTPVRPVPTKQFCTPIKDGEYWALGLPVIITAGISDDSELIRANGIGAVLDGLGPKYYQAAVETIDRLLATTTPKERYGLIRPIAEKYRNFGIAETVYKAVYGSKE
jgi:glycosyltransferase involved in cell wall biosynthesis